MLKHIWGNACWFLFHTLAEKLKPEYDTSEELQTILYHFKQVCYNLPCPSCSEHAVKHLEKAIFRNVKTRDDLKMFFLEFHNIVNKRLDKKIFTKNQCDEMYIKANLIKIVNHFISVMKNKELSSERTMMNTMGRHLCVDSISKYIRQNGYKFNP